MSDWHCPKCARDTDHLVIDSRPIPDRAAIRRRRECSICQHRLTTYEHQADRKLFEAIQAPDDEFERGLWYVRKGLRLLDPGQDLRRPHHADEEGGEGTDKDDDAASNMVDSPMPAGERS